MNQKESEVIKQYKTKHDALVSEYELLKANHAKLKSRYNELIRLTNRADIRLIISLTNLIIRVPLIKRALRALKRLKHYSKEAIDSERVRLNNVVDGGSNIIEWPVSNESISKLKQYEQSPEHPRKYALVTALYGASDQLMLPLSIRNDFDYFCFSDEARDTFGLWKIVKSPYFHSDPTRMARYVKTHLNSLFPDYDAIIWCDANIRFESFIYDQFDKFCLGESDASFIKHIHRDCFYKEAEACIELNKDNSEVIRSQISRYREIGVKENQGMYETGLHFIKPNKNKVMEFYNFWWKEIVIGSKRDQLSILPAINHSKLNVDLLLNEGLCVRTCDETELIPHKQLKHMITPKILSDFYSVSEPKKIETTFKIEKRAKTDVIICVYNALDDVKLCFESVVKHSYKDLNKIIFVNDCSDQETLEFLLVLEKNYEKVTLVNNQVNLGYTKSANIGLKESNADFRIVLNSDTIVTRNWLSKMVSVAYSSTCIGIVGPISNAAGSQSVPSTKGTKGQTAINSLPEGYTLADMGKLSESFADVYPAVPLIHGFCIGIKSTVIDRIGYFDEVNFERYYGEENDYCLRAYQEGFDLVVATNTYIFHSKSKSIEEEERIIHMSKAGQKLRDLYGKQEMRNYCLQLENNPNLIEVRERFDSKCYS